jgi:hypothetical protein
MPFNMSAREELLCCRCTKIGNSRGSATKVCNHDRLNAGSLRRVHNHIMDLFNTQKAEGFFVPVVDDTTLKCRDRLPWWRAEVSVAREACYSGPRPSSPILQW